jgi:hypothetical protein
MSQVNILFYSNFCEGSKQLIALLESEKLTKFFHLICTDNNAEKIPPQIKCTPTLIIRGVPVPYVAADAFRWFSKVKQWKVQMLMQRLSMAQQQYLKSTNNNLITDANNSNVLGFSTEEMGGMSDIFAYLQSDDAMPHSYVPPNSKDYIFTPPLEDGQYKINSDGKYKINPLKQKELQTKLESERREQDKSFKENIDNFRKQFGTK